MPKLQISIPNVGDITHELLTDEVTIGRSTDNKIQIKDKSVSLSHARLIKEDGVYRLEDLSSTNGTFCNGAQVRHKVLDDSAALRFGNIAAFFYPDPTRRPDNTLKEEIRKLQGQLASVREARDLVHQRNQELLQERDEATLATEIAKAELAEAQRQATTGPAVDPAQIKQLEKRLEEQRGQVLSLLEERKNLEKRLEERTAAEEEHAGKTRELEQQIAAAGQDRTSLEQKLTEFAADVEKLRVDLAQAREAESKIRRELTEETQKDRSTAEQELTTAREAEKSAIEARDRLTQELENLRKEQAETTGQAAEREKALEAQLAEQKALAGKLESDRRQSAEAAERELSGLREEARSHARKLDAIESEHQAENDRWDHDQTLLKRELETLRIRHDELVGELDSARATAAGEGESMNVALRDLRTELEQAKAANASTEGARGAIESELKSRLTELEMARGELQRSLDARKGDLEERGRKIEALEAEKNSLEERLAREHEKVSVVRSESEKSAGELQTLRRDLEQARQQAESNAKERDSLRRQQQALMGQLDEQKAAHAASSQNSDGLTAEMEKLKAELSTVREGISALEAERNEEARRKDEIEQRLRESERSRSEEVQSWRDVQEKSAADLTAAETRAAEAEANLQKRTAELETLRQQMETLAAAAQKPPVSMDDPFANGHTVEPREPEVEGGSKRSRRSLGFSEQRVSYSSGENVSTQEAVAGKAPPRWIGRKQRSGDRPRAGAGAPVFPDDVVEQDRATIMKLPELIAQARGDLQYLIRHPNDKNALETLIRRAHEMSDLARTTVFQPIYKMASALDSLLADLRSTPERINQATLRTVTQSLDFMSALVDPERVMQTLGLPEPHVLVVDDEADIIEAIVDGMELVGLLASGSTDPQIALEELGKEKFDLVFLDVRLPDVTGWDVCQKIRAIPEHRRTPIVFVTGLASIENKVKSTLQGGNDFVGKPFNVREIGIKALSWVYRGQLGMI